jgi:uncharacterized integral membrane protein
MDQPEHQEPEGEQQEPQGALPAPAVGQGRTKKRAVRSTNAGRIWVALFLAVALLTLLIVFVAENSGGVTVTFFGAHGHISLALALIIAALVGAVVTLLVGSTRILQLRAQVRRSGR